MVGEEAAAAASGAGREPGNASGDGRCFGPAGPPSFPERV